jgi:hypothetical protein
MSVLLNSAMASPDETNPVDQRTFAVVKTKGEEEQKEGEDVDGDRPCVENVSAATEPKDLNDLLENAI